jgi:hypothetical protein
LHKARNKYSFEFIVVLRIVGSPPVPSAVNDHSATLPIPRSGYKYTQDRHEVLPDYHHIEGDEEQQHAIPI